MEGNISAPLISVIVPVYKVEGYIDNCLGSLLEQSYSNWEAILVDDGSPDSSGEICERYARRDSRFKVVHKENGGQSSARNLAMEHVEGDYIFFLDSDDFLAVDAFEYLMAVALENDADIVQCDYIRGCTTEFPELSTKSQLKLFDQRTIFTHYAAKIIPWGKLYRREVIGDIRFPEGLINEDDFTVWKYYYNASIIVVSNRPLYYYTVNPGSTMSQKVRKPDLRYFEAYRERIDYFNGRGEVDLEAVSRVQWMKSLVITYSNPFLTKLQRQEILSRFIDNYEALWQLDFRIPTKLNAIFHMFRRMPWLASKLVVRLYNR